MCYSDATKGGSKLEMLSNVKGQMSSWIGSVQVPSVPNIFSKGGETGPTEAGDAKVDSPTSGESVKGSPELKDEDDNSRYRYISLFLCLEPFILPPKSSFIIVLVYDFLSHLL